MAIPLNNRIAGFLALLLVLISLVYFNTLYAPFNFDDEIVLKYQIVDKGSVPFWDNNKSLFDNFYPPRYRHLFFISLDFNYSKGALNPLGYHLTNLSLHFLTSVIVFFITFITISKGMSWEKKAAYSIAVITTLFFALNPVHSETVNYISARSVGMSSFFYLFALLFYILGSFRERSSISRCLLYLLSLVSFIASVLSKETALTFLAIVFLYDICFMRKGGWTSVRNRVLFFYLPFLACGAFAVFKVPFYTEDLSLKTIILDWWQKIDFSYGLRQARIVGHGVHLLLFPIGLTFDYDFPDTFFPHPIARAWPILFAFGLILLTAKFFRNALAIVSFGVLWFLLVLSPTNSILPRTDLLSERNLYLPSFGIFLLLVVSGYHLVLAKHNRPIIRKVGVSFLVVFFIFQTVLLYDRNTLYRSNILLWEDTLKKAPGKLRALHNLSHFYLIEKNYQKAFITLQSLAKSNASPHYVAYAHSNLGALYLELGDYTKAEAEFKKGIKVKPTLPTNYLNLGTVYASQGRYQKAKEAYEKTESLYKNFKWGYEIPSELYLNKARTLLILGLYKEAENSVVHHLKRFPAPGLGHFTLGKIYTAMGKLTDALREYEQSGNDPKLKAQAHNNRALIFIQQYHFNRAYEELNRAITIYPNLYDAHYNLGNLLIQTNSDPFMARKHFKIALKISNNQESQRRIKLALDNLLLDFQGLTVAE